MHRHRRQTSISILRVTNPDVDKSAAEPTNPNESISNQDTSNDFLKFGEAEAVNISSNHTSSNYSDQSGPYLTGSPDAPTGLLQPRAYEAPLRVSPGFTPQLSSPTLELLERDPLRRNNSEAALDRKPGAQTEDIRSSVYSTVPTRDPIYPVTYTFKSERKMATDSKVPQPGPARIAKGGGPDEWLEAAKQCKYLPEAHMKQLCETVKEFLMEG